MSLREEAYPIQFVGQVIQNVLNDRRGNIYTSVLEKDIKEVLPSYISGIANQVRSDDQHAMANFEYGKGAFALNQRIVHEWKDAMQMK